MMAKHSDETYKLLAALKTVEHDARKQIEYFEKQMNETETNRAYWQERIDEAKAGKYWAFLRYMTIDPD